jgi:hypothetical protein
MARDALAAGRDPALESRNAARAYRQGESVDDLIEAYIARHATPHMMTRSAAEDTRLLRQHVAPVLGRRKAVDIRRRDINHLIADEAFEGGQVTDSRRVARPLKHELGHTGGRGASA